jgi:small subunit ribosomal protein S13
MPRITGVDSPVNKRLDIALTYIYGVGPKHARYLCDAVKLPYEMRAKDLTDEQAAQINQAIESAPWATEGNLRRQILENVSRLKNIRCYRGMRHVRGLPVRGQRTRTNARTRKGPKKTVARKKGVKGR